MTNGFPVEFIPPEDILYRRVYRGYIKKGRVKPNAFRDSDPTYPGQRVGVSVLWQRYATPEDCKRTGKEPEDNGVATLLTEKVRSIDELLVEHDPLPESQGHSQIFGEKDEEVRVRLAREANLIISPG